MKTLRVSLSDRAYPIAVGRDVLSRAGVLLSQRGFETAPIVVTNPKVWRLHGGALERSLEKAFDRPTVIKIGDGERFKEHSTLLEIYDEMFRARADRSSWILAFGGGVVGDIAGFAAATFMRGIRFAMAPTTLLSQVDSSIGGKVGINVPQGKNLVGAFHQPEVVLSDTGVLKTLARRELASGLYEAIKSAAIYSEPLLDYLERKLPEILSCSPGPMEHVVAATSAIKAAVVATDEKESGLRMTLNYGHTIGHAFETATGYARFKHGEAVGWGMIAALEYGRELGFLDSRESLRLTRLIHRASRLPSLKGISFESAWQALARDKKFSSGDIRMVLLTRIGKAEVLGGIDRASLEAFLRRFMASGGRVR